MQFKLNEREHHYAGLAAWKQSNAENVFFFLFQSFSDSIKVIQSPLKQYLG